VEAVRENKGRRKWRLRGKKREKKVEVARESKGRRERRLRGKKGRRKRRLQGKVTGEEIGGCKGK
jgi:hypothetical protein